MTICVKESAKVLVTAKEDRKVCLSIKPIQISVTVANAGIRGVGVPAGGRAGSVLIKKTDLDFDTAWAEALDGGEF
jgi:hypothetical protein